MKKRARGWGGCLGASIAALFGIVGLVGTVGCHADPSTPQGRAELFLDAYYVEINLPRALEQTAGIARAKVEQSIELTKGQVLDESTQRPRVHYRFAEEHPDGDATVNYVYLADITADGDTSQRKFMLTVRRQDDDWKVTNFSEFTP